MVVLLEATQCSKLSLHASQLDADICQAIKRISAHVLNFVDINISIIISLFIKWFFGWLFLQLGFTLLTLIWEFDFPPFMVLIIAILNDGKSLSRCLHNHPTTFAFCSQRSITCKLSFCAFLNDYDLIKVSGLI